MNGLRAVAGSVEFRADCTAVKFRLFVTGALDESRETHPAISQSQASDRRPRPPPTALTKLVSRGCPCRPRADSSPEMPTVSPNGLNGLDAGTVKFAKENGGA